MHLKIESQFSASSIYSHVSPAPELGATAHFIKPANRFMLIIESIHLSIQVLIRVFKPRKGIFCRERKIKIINLNQLNNLKPGNII